MPRLPVITAKNFIKILITKGFVLDRISGSHHIFRHSDGRKATIPVHGNKEIPKGTLLSIMKDLGISREELA